jgi:hypothetical protein
MVTQTLAQPSIELTLREPSVSDPVTYAGGQGYPDFPCLSRAHAPSSCVPCVDFSPWLRNRIHENDVNAVGEYLWRVRQANPGVGESAEQFRERFRELAAALLATPLTRYLEGGSEEAYLDLRVTLVLLAVHENFSGFIMTGEAPDFVAAVMAPHALSIRGAEELIELRNAFVLQMGQEMSYWANWPTFSPALRRLAPPEHGSLRVLLDALRKLPLGTRAHAVDALRHLSADPQLPRTLPSLSRYESRKRGLDVSDSSRRIVESGLVVPASDLAAWLSGWTRRDLLGFLAQSGVSARNSWSKERLAEVAKAECTDLLRERMTTSGAVELAPAHVEAARRLRAYVDRARETWRVWLAFGAGVQH